MEGDLMGKEKQWYKRVMKWTSKNMRGYLTLKSIQMCVSMFLFGVSLVLFFKYWRTDDPDSHLVVTMRLILGMLAVDIATFLCDFIMVLKRWAFFISLRFIICSVSVTLSTIIMIHFFSEKFQDGTVQLDFKSGMELWICFIMLYIF